MKIKNAFVSVCFVLVAGCAHIENPMTVPVGPKDAEIYEAGMIRTQRLKETQISVDVFVDCDNIVIRSPDNQMSPVEARALLSSQIDGVLRAQLQRFPFFRVTAGDSTLEKVRARRLITDAEAGVAPLLEQRERADYTVLARVDSVYSHGDGGVPNAAVLGGAAMTADGIAEHSPETSAIGGMIAGISSAFEPNVVEMSMTFEFYDNVHGRSLHIEHVDRTYEGTSKHNTGSTILRAARDCIAQYGEMIAREYGRESRVLSTRGDGEYAWISIGSKDGVAAGAHVLFYGFADAGDIIESWDHVEEPVAYGVVIGVPDEHTCWAHVEQFDKIAVRKYHYVKVIAVPKTSGFAERIGL